MARKNKAFHHSGGIPQTRDNATVRESESDIQKVELKLSQDISMYVSTGNSQDQGARDYQEDSFGYSNIIDPEIVSRQGLLAILSDGMGGLADGKVVSDYCVQASISMFSSIDPTGDVGSQLREMIITMNDQICSKYNEKGVSKAGATLVLAHIYKNCLHWAVVGDSRLYCIRNNKMFQLNEDHDYKNSLLRDYIAGKAEFEDAENDPQKDSLVSFIGRENISKIDVCRKGFKIRPNDAFILCSDGIYNSISTEAMKEIIEANSAQTASEKIVKDIVEADWPGQDNMTIMIIKCLKKK